MFAVIVNNHYSGISAIAIVVNWVLPLKIKQVYISVRVKLRQIF
jgi:hypothetical protein